MSLVLVVGSAGKASCSDPKISRQCILFWSKEQQIMSLVLVLGSTDSVSCSGPRISRKCLLFRF